MNKRAATILILTVLFFLLLAGGFYFLNNKYRFLADIIGPPYQLFVKSPLEPVFADTVPADSEIINSGGTIQTFAALGQNQPITFSVRPNQDLGSAQVEVTDLKDGDKTIAKKNIEIYNVKIWPQCGPKDLSSETGSWHFHCNDPNLSASYDVPELLVKDNEQDLVADERGFVPSEGKYYPPTANENFNVILKNHQTHTFYLNIKVPKDASSGDYQATVTFKPEQAGGQSFKINLEVLPFELPNSGKEILTFSTQRVSGNYQGGLADIGREKYEKYLDFLKENGLTSLLITGTEDLEWIAQKMKEKGFKGTFIWRPQNHNPSYLQPIIKAIKNYGFDVYIYSFDEPFDSGRLIQSILLNKKIHQADGKSTSAITKQAADLLNDPIILLFDLVDASTNDKVDFPIYAMGSNTSIYDTNIDYSWYLSIYKKKVFFSPWISGAQTYYDSSQQGTEVSADEWHHIAGVWDAQSGEYKTYLDDNFDVVYKPTAQASNKIPKNMQKFTIGVMNNQNAYPNNFPFTGEIDDLKIYNHALSLDELNQSGQNPQAYYQFNEGSGNSTSDSAGKQANCTIQNATWTSGQEGSALHFNGSNAYLDCDSNNNFNISDSMTVEAWIKLPAGFSDTHKMIAGKTTAPVRQQGRIEDYIAGLYNGTVEKNPYKEFYYFQIWPEPSRWALWANVTEYKRVLSGFFLYNSGIDGISPYGLDSMYPCHGNKFYDDFDAADKEWRAIYPTTQGWIKTIEFEAFRAGIDDIRYLTQFDNVLAKLEKKDAVKAEEIRQAVKEKLAIYHFAGADGKDSWTLPDSINQANRKFITDRIVEAQNLLGGAANGVENVPTTETPEDQSAASQREKNTVETAKPEPPTKVKVETSYSENILSPEVKISWQPSPTEGIESYAVYRWQDSSQDFAKIGTSDKNTLEFFDKSVESDKSYTYMARSIKNSYESDNSNQATVEVRSFLLDKYFPIDMLKNPWVIGGIVSLVVLQLVLAWKFLPALTNF